LSAIRKKFSAQVLEIRVDANGAFNYYDCKDKLNRLAKFKLHSIEQPIKAGQWSLMAELCKTSPIAIALDEELIGVSDKTTLLNTLNPHYIVLKPSLIGGLTETGKWAQLAQNLDIGWWVTSALESNVGLNAIAQWVAINGSGMPQGLGTGKVFSNNIASPLYLKADELWYAPHQNWEM
jgi:o-succinylbenzoate synthase